MKDKQALIMLFFLIAANPLIAQSWQTSSMDQQSAVVELFVAEGCGLCPPAEKWLEETAQTEPYLIPLVYHVDYLNDKKAWVDRFAKSEFTQRQQQLAKINLFKTIFTPEFFISGEVVHSWREHAREVISFVNGFEPEVNIEMQATFEQKQLAVTLQVALTEPATQADAKLYLIVKEDNILSEIKGGDNYGATFNHQDLVRVIVGPFDIQSAGQTKVVKNIPLQNDWNSQQLELVAFVQDLNNGFILQGVTLPLTE